MIKKVLEQPLFFFIYKILHIKFAIGFMPLHAERASKLVSTILASVIFYPMVDVILVSNKTRNGLIFLVA